MTTSWSSASDAPSATPIVDVRGLSLWYPLRGERTMRRQFLGRTDPHRLWALRDVTVALHEGTVVGIVGGNGAGKSTLCLVIAGILQPDEGEVEIRGKVSTLFGLGQGFNRELSGRENIRLYAALLGIPRRTILGRMDEIIDFTELGDFIDEPVAHYSSGMRARLAFSVSMVLESDILLLDEVLSVGDARFQEKSRARLLERMDTSRLIAIVSHDLPLLREVVTHGLWLEKGRCRAFGPATEVLDAYEREMGTEARPNRGSLKASA